MTNEVIKIGELLEQKKYYELNFNVPEEEKNQV